jgi:hypothetical protein
LREEEEEEVTMELLAAGCSSVDVLLQLIGGRVRRREETGDGISKSDGKGEGDSESERVEGEEAGVGDLITVGRASKSSLIA